MTYQPSGWINYWDLRTGNNLKRVKTLPDLTSLVISPDSRYIAAANGDDLLLIDGRVKAATLNIEPKGPSEVGLAEDGQCLYARIAKDDLAKLKADSIESLLAEAQQCLPTVKSDLPTWDYT